MRTYQARLAVEDDAALRAYRHIALDVSFAYGGDHLLAALRGGQAMSYRFLLDDKGWRVFASTAVIETPILSDVRIGVDFNVGFVSVSETDRFGNIVAGQDLLMVTAGMSKHATQTAISAAVKDIVAIACRVQKPISIEYLNFTKKKAQLSYASPGRQRRLSSFAYTRFAQTIGARAHDAGNAGIEVVEVRAAYSSKIGAQKYAHRYGLSGHRAAAFVLARRGQHFPDRLKPSSRKRFATTCKDRRELVPARAKARCLPQGKGDRGKAWLETYLRPPAMAIPATPQRRKRPEIEKSEVRGETPRCNFYASTRSGVGGLPTADFGQRNRCL